MFNRYEIHFLEKIGDATSFKKAMDIAQEILDTIKKYPEEEDEYQYLQIHCYWWFDRFFGVKDKRGVKKHTLVVWSDVKKRFVINSF